MKFIRLALMAAVSSLAVTQSCDTPTHTFIFGKVHATVVTDGPVVSFGNAFSVPGAAVSRSYRASFRNYNPIVLQQNAVVLDMPRARILVDTGAFNIPQFDAFAEGGRLVSNLKRARIDPSSINAVFLTHAHGDHSSGLINRRGEAAFPNATVYVGKTEHEFWTANPIAEVKTGIPPEQLALFASIYIAAIKPYLDAGRLRLVKDNGSPLPGTRFLPTPGHSPGHMAIEFTSKGETLVVSGDAWISQPDQLQNPEWGFSVETDNEEAYRSRIRLMELTSKRRNLVLSYHEQFPGLGYVQRNGHLFDWVPASGIDVGRGKC